MVVVERVKIINKLLKLPACTLLTTGRTGTDFLQSLLDSHPEVLTFNGHLFSHDFWNNSVCINAGKFDLSDLLNEFIGKHIEKFKSRYDIKEGKDHLGENQDQTIDINLNQFKSEVINLLDGQRVNSKNFLVAIYAAYAICLGHDIEKKTLLFHHLHHFHRLGDYLKDFPESKIICMTRDPRANFVSGIEHWREFDSSTDQEVHLYFYIKRILEDATVLNKFNNEYIVIKIEDLGDEDILKKLCEWLNISYSDCLKRSTWGGLAWYGDKLSAKKNQYLGWSRTMLQNKWEVTLSPRDKYVFNYIMLYRLKHYGYSYKNINIFSSTITPFLILLPLSYELRFFSRGYIQRCLLNKEYSKIVKNFLFYFRRVCLFSKYYLQVLARRGFNQPYLKKW